MSLHDTIKPPYYYNLNRAFASVKRPAPGIGRNHAQEILSWRKWLSLTITQAVERMEGYAMPAKAIQGRDRQPDFQFAVIRLNEKQVDAFHKWVKTVEGDVVTAMRDFAVSGYKFSLTADLENNCFIASYTQRGAGHVHANVTVSSRSDDWEEAYWLTVFKLTQLYKDTPLPVEPTKNNWG